VALAYSAACTPDTFVFDGHRRLVYRGQLDAARPASSRTGVPASTASNAARTSAAVTGPRRVLTGAASNVGDTSGVVTAIDIAGHDSPTRAWTIQVGTVSTGSVVVGDGGRLYTTADSALIAIDDQGPQARVAWRADPGDGISEVSAGLAADGTALLGTNGRQEWAYRFDGKPLWHAPRIITYSSPSVTDTGLADVADHSGTVHVFRTSDGTQATTYQATQAQIWSATVIDAHYRVYFGTQSGHAVGLDASGSPLFDIDLGAPVDSYPALTADANLIIGARNGTLSAVG
jgi:outer membrane protein assembly factor BamB